MEAQVNSTKQWRNFYWCFSKSPKRLKRKVHFQSYSLKPPKPEKAPKRENHRQILLINIDEKFLNKIMEKWIQQHIQMIIHHEQVRFIPGIQGCFSIHKSIIVTYHISTVKCKNHMIFSIDKKFIKFNSFMIKILNSLSIQGLY